MRILLCFVVGAIADAQTTDPDHIFVKPYVGRASAAPNSNVPMGILPVQYRAAYGFNRTPNQGQGQTIALVVAYDDPNVADDLAFYANYFHLTPCNFQKVKVGNPFEGGARTSFTKLLFMQPCRELWLRDSSRCQHQS